MRIPDDVLHHLGSKIWWRMWAFTQKRESRVMGLPKDILDVIDCSSTLKTQRSQADGSDPSTQLPLRLAANVSAMQPLGGLSYLLSGSSRRAFARIAT